MTLTNASNKSEHSANGVSVEFTYEFPILDADHLHVYVDGVKKETNDVTYGHSIVGVGDPEGEVVFNTAPPLGDYISLVRSVPVEQQTRYPTYDPFPSATHEAALDYLTMIAQQLGEEIGRAIQSPIGADPATSFVLPAYDAGKALMWDEATQSLTVSDDQINGVIDQCNTALASCQTALVDCGLVLNSCNASLGLSQTARDAAIVAQLAAETAQSGAEAAETAAGVIQTEVEAFPDDGHQWSAIQHNAYTDIGGMATREIDFEGTPEYNVGLTQNLTITFSNIGTGADNWGKSVFFRFYNASGSGYTITWPASVKWMPGADKDGPASGEEKLICIYALDSGTQYGMLVWEG